jgi:CheY-like chemotaxis protein
VDDEPDLVEALVLRFLAENGCEVETAQDGEEALCKAFNFRPDAVVLDVAMPEMDGWEVCRRLRADSRTRDVPIVIASAWLNGNMKERAEKAGASCFFLKPFVEKELVEAVFSLIGTPVGD